MNTFFESEYSVEDLEQFRDEEGFIDLSKAGIQITDESREHIGNPERLKNWIDFKGKKVLIKGETILDQEKNYGLYAELIVEEIAKQLGIETAHYDLIKINDQNGKSVMGVLSESVVDYKTEQLITLRDIIGDEPQEEGDFADTTTYQFTVDKLRENLLESGYSKENVDEIVSDYKKRLLFTLSVLDTDKHTENIAFIRGKDNGKYTIKISPNYDSEAALMLDYDIPTISKLLEDYDALKQGVDDSHPRIGTLKSIEDGGFDWYWIDTLEAICEDEEAYEYYYGVLKKGVDMDVVLDNVEKRINAPLPENVRLLAKYSYNIRNEDMEKVMSGEILPEHEQEDIDIDFLLSSLIDRGTKNAGIRTGEQLQVGKSMKKDMEPSQEMDIDSILDNLFGNR